MRTKGGAVMGSASGRQRPLVSRQFHESERPLSGKAGIQEMGDEESLRNDRITPTSGHSVRIEEMVCK